MHDKVINGLSIPKVKKADLVEALFEDEEFLKQRNLPCPRDIVLLKNLMEILVQPNNGKDKIIEKILRQQTLVADRL